MLVAELGLAGKYDYLSERLNKAYKFLSETDLASLPCGRCDIDGDDVYANVMDYVTTAPSEKSFEAHRSYYDVHCVASGAELMQVAAIGELEPETEFDEANDYALYSGAAPCTTVLLKPGSVAVVAPEDAHKPGCAVGEAGESVHKVVVKVRVAR